MKSVVSNSEADERIAALQPFRNSTGSLRGVEGAVEEQDRYLPEADWLNYRELAGRGEVAYTVLSYDTVIGYALRDGGVVVPQVRYSLTTTQHQTAVREAWGQRRSFDPEAYAREVSMVTEVRDTSRHANGRSGGW